MKDYFIFGEMAERSNAAVLKTVDCNRSGGSNPSLSASIKTKLQGLLNFSKVFFFISSSENFHKAISLLFFYSILYYFFIAMKKYAVSLFLIFLILFEYKMERDKIKNIRYFEEYINKKEELNCRIKSWFINGEINPDRREIMLEKMFQNNIYSLIAKYSAGYPIEELYTDYYDALGYMHQSWMVLDNRAYLKDTKYNHYFGSDYDLMLWMLSLGYLLD